LQGRVEGEVILDSIIFNIPVFCPTSILVFSVAFRWVWFQRCSCFHSGPPNPTPQTFLFNLFHGGSWKIECIYGIGFEIACMKSGLNCQKSRFLTHVVTNLIKSTIPAFPSASRVLKKKKNIYIYILHVALEAHPRRTNIQFSARGCPQVMYIVRA